MKLNTLTVDIFEDAPQVQASRFIYQRHSQ